MIKTENDYTSQSLSYLGKEVEIKIDRPLGSTHPKHKNIVYPINYGYIPEVFSADGEELDVYLLGVDEPVTEYTARIIAIVHRRDDNEDKLIAVPEGISFTNSHKRRNYGSCSFSGAVF